MKFHRSFLQTSFGRARFNDVVVTTSSAPSLLVENRYADATLGLQSSYAIISGLYYERITVAIYDCNERGLYYKCVTVVIYDRNDWASTIKVL